MSDGMLRIYFRLPVALQNVAVSLYGARLRSLRYGRIHRKTLSDLRASQHWESSRIHEWQTAELRKVTRHAARSVRLYQNRGLRGDVDHDFASLQEVPLLTKEDLRRPREELIPATYHGDRTLEVHTGGTTGKPLVVHCDRTVLQKNYAFFSRFLEWAGVTFGARVATFAGRTLVPPERERPPFWRYNAAMRQLLCSSYHLSESTIPDYVEALARFQPELIDSYPSSVRPIARYLVANGIRSVTPRAVVTSSETLDEPTRELLVEAFGCPVFDHYGAAEMAALVTQCERGSYHVNPEFGIVELVKEGKPVGLGESGEIVATGFINHVMPLIRYQTGDWASWGDGSCSCGRAFPVLSQVEGRRDDVLITPEGRLIGRLDPIFKSVDSVYETRIVQDRPDHVRVELVPTENYAPGDEEVLRTELQRRMGPSVDIDVVLVQRLPRTAGGKLRAVVNEVAVSD